jgi:hypothetical protein
MALSPKLEAIRDCMNKHTGDGRDHPKAVKLAEAYVKANPDMFASFKDLSLEDCVKSVSVFRAAGMEEEEWRVETYLLAKFEPQSIGGEYHPTVRLPEL